MFGLYRNGYESAENSQTRRFQEETDAIENKKAGLGNGDCGDVAYIFQKDG